jgi:hypothetical protein
LERRNLRVLELAIENINLGYTFQQEQEALVEFDRILTEAGSVWRLDIQRIESGALCSTNAGNRCGGACNSCGGGSELADAGA